MTEAEWLTESNPDAMLQVFIGTVSPPWRKLLLFASACLYRIRDLIPEGPCLRAVQLSQEFSDEMVHTPEFDDTLAWADKALERLWQGPDHAMTRVEYWSIRAAYGFLRWCGHERVGLDVAYNSRMAPARRAWCEVARHDDLDTLQHAKEVLDGVASQEACIQCDLIRDIFGNPFRPLTLNPAVLVWNDGVIVRLARAAYDGRHLPDGELELHRLSVLADALEEAGAHGEMVAHLRGAGPHVRGCFVVDLCLGLT